MVWNFSVEIFLTKGILDVIPKLNHIMAFEVELLWVPLVEEPL